jgi:hypothetical protein
MSREELDKKIYGKDSSSSSTDAEKLPLKAGNEIDECSQQQTTPKTVIFTITEEEDQYEGEEEEEEQTKTKSSKMKRLAKMMLPSQTTATQRREDTRP